MTIEIGTNLKDLLELIVILIAAFPVMVVWLRMF
jgi:hypothetical protein